VTSDSVFQGPEAPRGGVERVLRAVGSEHIRGRSVQMRLTTLGMRLNGKCFGEMENKAAAYPQAHLGHYQVRSLVEVRYR
jgi:hypothetical protein